jgi:hypothetical protein
MKIEMYKAVIFLLVTLYEVEMFFLLRNIVAGFYNSVLKEMLWAYRN